MQPHKREAGASYVDVAVASSVIDPCSMRTLFMDSCGLCPLLILTALYSTEGRHLSEITGVLQRLSEKHPQQSPHWNKFASMKKEKEDGAHLGSLEWKEILVDVWNNV